MSEPSYRITINCVCGEQKAFRAPFMQDIVSNGGLIDAAGWQMSPTLDAPGIYLGMCPECSSDPGLGID